MLYIKNRLAGMLGADTAWRLRYLQDTLSVLRRRAIPIPRECSICRYRGLFRPFGWPIRPEAQCPKCGSLERNRLLKLWFDQNNAQLIEKRVLHFAAEPPVESFVRPVSSEYVTADLAPGSDLQLNIEKIALPDGRFDALLCSHVLEHVDDIKALAELHRILAPRGIAILLVPLVEGWDSTYEDTNIQGGADRELHFGQSDHVRMYGRDFRERVINAGFDLDEFTADGPASIRFGLLHGEKIFIGRRR